MTRNNLSVCSCGFIRAYSATFQWLNITPYHAQTVLELGDRHKDPFDRLLIAQAKYEKLCIVTYDGVFQDYLDDVLFIMHISKNADS